MIAQAGPQAKWSVMWRGKKGYMAEKRFENDFAGALETYVLLLNAGKKWVTLRCVNVGFSPPEHIINHEVQTWKVVTKRGKKFKKKVTTIHNRMEDYNSEGTYWCPYCIKLRVFWEDRSDSRLVIMRCPVCEIGTDNWHVKRWNPQAKTLEFRTTRRANARPTARPRRGRGIRRSA